MHHSKFECADFLLCSAGPACTSCMFPWWPWLQLALHPMKNAGRLPVTASIQTDLLQSLSLLSFQMQAAATKRLLQPAASRLSTPADPLLRFIWLAAQTL